MTNDCFERARQGYARRSETWTSVFLNSSSSLANTIISAGLTAAIAGSAVLACGSHLEYLAPFWRVILADYGLAITLRLGLALAVVEAALYGLSRAAGLAYLGRRVDLVDRSIRRGEGDAELAEDQARFLFHGPAVARRTHAQTVLCVAVQIADRDARHGHVFLKSFEPQCTYRLERNQAHTRGSRVWSTQKKHGALLTPTP